MTNFIHNLFEYCKGVFSGIRQLPHFRLSHSRKVFSFLSKKEKIALAILIVVALVNVFFAWEIFYHNHTVLVASTGGLYEEGVVGQPTYINPLLAHSDADPITMSGG